MQNCDSKDKILKGRSNQARFQSISGIKCVRALLYLSLTFSYMPGVVGQRRERHHHINSTIFSSSFTTILFHSCRPKAVETTSVEYKLSSAHLFLILVAHFTRLHKHKHISPSSSPLAPSLSHFFPCSLSWCGERRTNEGKGRGIRSKKGSRAVCNVCVRVCSNILKRGTAKTRG